jgi:NTE family protein
MKALVHSGGGNKGAFGLGVLRKLLNEENVDYDIYTGVSVGALNTAMLSNGPLKETLPVLEKVWFDIKGNSDVRKHYLLNYILASLILIVSLFIMSVVSIFLFSKIITAIFLVLSLASLSIPYFIVNNIQSVYRTGPLNKTVKSNFSRFKTITHNKELRVGAVCYETGELKIASQNDEDIADWVLTSAAFPIMFQMREYNKKHYTDGGVTDIALVKTAIELGATEVDVILCSPFNKGKYSNKLGLIDQVEHIIELMTTEILKNDVILAKTSYPNVKIRVFMPEIPYTVSALKFDPKLIRSMYNDGLNVKPTLL